MNRTLTSKQQLDMMLLLMPLLTAEDPSERQEEHVAALWSHNVPELAASGQYSAINTHGMVALLLAIGMVVDEHPAGAPDDIMSLLDIVQAWYDAGA